ncbi:gamma-glutamylcyclotransferase [Alkalicoccus chagannorensis]|uniref:gamma-glutamylcyclotransferase n=1 Tax=Alkalicoccus chagannorensis TaxID=427072 RepID=UPI000426D7AF|nr:gamma-glutamylcyclotransferase family protein [Alkalicoccus chagannorensis]
MKVFVYGTLRKGGRNSPLLQQEVCLYKKAYLKGSLYDTGNGYPAYVRDDEDYVYGEIYEVSDELLPVLDQLEGYKPERSTGNLFIRTERDVGTDDGPVTAYVYEYGDRTALKNKTAFQDWMVDRLLQATGNIQYFAYASCMDDQRIRAAGMETHFDQGERAVLQGWQLSYDFERSDGHRANLRESATAMEGVLYKVAPEGIDYLFQREGVPYGHYRPAAVVVETDSGRHLALTFIVRYPAEEKAPPGHYAAEVLRGAEKYLSNAYVQRMYDHLRSFDMEEEKEGSTTE